MLIQASHVSYGSLLPRSIPWTRFTKIRGVGSPGTTFTQALYRTCAKGTTRCHLDLLQRLRNDYREVLDFLVAEAVIEESLHHYRAGGYCRHCQVNPYRVLKHESTIEMAGALTILRPATAPAGSWTRVCGPVGRFCYRLQTPAKAGRGWIMISVSMCMDGRGLYSMLETAACGIGIDSGSHHTGWFRQ